MQVSVYYIHFDFYLISNVPLPTELPDMAARLFYH